MKTILRISSVWAFVTGLLLLGGMPSLAGAQAHGPMMRHGGDRPDGDLWLMIRAGNLTPDQQAKVRSILSSHRGTVRPLIEQLRQAQEELSGKLLGPGEIQTADLQPQLERIGRLREQIVQDSAQTALEVRDVLTPDQLARVVQVKDRLKQLRDETRQLLQPERP